MGNAAKILMPGGTAKEYHQTQYQQYPYVHTSTTLTHRFKRKQLSHVPPASLVTPPQTLPLTSSLRTCNPDTVHHFHHMKWVFRKEPGHPGSCIAALLQLNHHQTSSDGPNYSSYLLNRVTLKPELLLH